MTDNLLNVLVLPYDLELNTFLDQLGIQRLDLTPIGLSGSLITEETCQQAGVDFAFFQAFATLTHTEDGLRNNGALQLFGETPHELPSERQNGQEYGHLLLDKDEAIALKFALRILDKDDASSEIENGSLQHAELVRARINDLAGDSCWLTPEAMRLGIFGEVNGELAQMVGVYLFEGLPILRETTTAQEFACTYLPSMVTQERGLSFRPDRMPPNIQKAAKSTVIIEVEGGRGSGVVALQSKYILTAYHVVDGATEVDGKKKVLKVKISRGDETIESTAEVLEIPGTTTDKKPDLVVLYMPDLPETFEPLTFGTVDQEEEKAPEKEDLDQKRTESLKFLVEHTDLIQQLDQGQLQTLATYLQNLTKPLKYKSEVVYLIGVPHQREPVELLATIGNIDGVATQLDPSGRMHVTAIGLPGNSGGPAVNENGEIIGIVVELVPGEPFPGFSWLDPRTGLERVALEKREIVGSRIYYLGAEWGEKIKEVIAKHQRELPPAR